MEAKGAMRGQYLHGVALFEHEAAAFLVLAHRAQGLLAVQVQQLHHLLGAQHAAVRLEHLLACTACVGLA